MRFTLYKRCEKDGAQFRCPSYPRCSCDWYDRRRIDGRRVWVHLKDTARSKEAARLLAEKQRLDTTLIDEGVKKPPTGPVPLLSAYIQTYTTTPDVVENRKTIDKLTATLADFLAHVGDRRLDQVTDKMIDHWRGALLKRRSKMTGGTWSKNTVQRYFNSVKGMFSYAAAHVPGVESNPCAKLKDWSADPAERRRWQPEELWIIDQLPVQYGLPLRVGLLSTARRSEVLTLTKHALSPKGFSYPNVSPKVGWIEVQRKKKRAGMVKERIPLVASLVDELRAQLKSPFQVHVFGDPPPDPGAWSSLLTRELRHIGEQYDVDTAGLCMHGTRHTAATTLEAAPGVGTRTT